MSKAAVLAFVSPNLEADGLYALYFRGVEYKCPALAGGARYDDDKLADSRIGDEDCLTAGGDLFLRGEPPLFNKLDDSKRFGEA